MDFAFHSSHNKLWQPFQPWLLGATENAVEFAARSGYGYGMNATLTVDVETEVLEQAAREAQAHNSSLPQAVERLLCVMAENWRLSTEGRTPVTDSLRGCAPLASDGDHSGN